MKRYLIIGASAGAVGATEAIREADSEGEIVVISDEGHPTYSRPMIADYLSGGLGREKLCFPSGGFWERHKVQVRLGERAVKLDLPRKAVEFDNAERINFDKLLLATGGKPLVPNIEGINRAGVFSFSTLADAVRIGEAIGRAQKAVIVGGGPVSVCAAEALAKRGLMVTVVERKDWLLSSVLDSDAAGIVETAMREKGVSIITGRTVRGISGRKDGGASVGGVELDDGTGIDCDMVVLAIGVAPRVEIAAQTGLKTNRGILVDRHMQTSVPDIYACGDVAEAYDFTEKRDRVLGLWPVARIGGRTAGSNMAGHRCEYPGGTAMSALNYFGVPIISAGLSAPDEGEGYETLLFADTAGVYRKIVLRNGVIAGFSLVGEVETAGILFNLMKNQVEVKGFGEKLISDGFSLACLPEGLRRGMFGV